MKLAKVFCTQLGTDAKTLEHPFLTTNGEPDENGDGKPDGVKNRKRSCKDLFPGSEKMNLDAWRESCKTLFFYIRQKA